MILFGYKNYYWYPGLMGLGVLAVLEFSFVRAFEWSSYLVFPSTSSLGGVVLALSAFHSLFFECVSAKGSAKKRDAYEIFGVTQSTFDLKTLSSTYNKLRLEYHPDKNKSPDAEEKYRDIEEAYQILSDDKKRRLYDRYGYEGVKDGGGQASEWGGGGSDFFDMFSNMSGFHSGGRGFHEPQKRKSETLSVPLSLSLEEAYNGAFVNVDIEVQGICSHCRGSGAQSPSDIVKCPSCQGRGMRKTVGSAMGMYFESTRPCEQCQATGKILKTPCSQCKAKKISVKSTEQLIQTDEGVATGDKILTRDCGHEHPDKLAGDVLFHVFVEPHALFKRISDDLFCTKEITLSQALFGFKTHLPFLNGKSIALERSQITPPGFVEKIPNFGMPKNKLFEDSKPTDQEFFHFNPYGPFYKQTPSKNSKFGDLYVTYHVVFPKTLSETQKKSLSAVFTNDGSQYESPSGSHLDL